MENFTPNPADPQEILIAACMAILKERRPDPLPQRVLAWTGSKAEAVELIYCLSHVGVFDNGRASTTQIIKWFEQSFQIDLGNTSKIFQDIKSRKKETTSLARRMEKALLQYIDDLDREDADRSQMQRRA